MIEDTRAIQYLGSKLQILDDIENEISKLVPQNGIVCDLFSGSGIVSQRLSGKNIVYANDVQEYSRIITSVLLGCGRNKKQRNLNYADLIQSEYYKNNHNYLSTIFEKPLSYEKNVLSNGDLEKLAELCELNLFYDGSELNPEKIGLAESIFGNSLSLFSPDTIKQLHKDKEPKHMLFSLYYLNSYFSLNQCIEIDSISFALKQFYSNREISKYEYQLLTVCLLHAVSEIVSSVGKNFAQPIKVVDKRGEIKSFAIKRCLRDRCMGLETPFEDMRTRLWSLPFPRYKNLVFKNDAADFVYNSRNAKPVNVFYLDPPYTIDHYSRFYHILETLVLYDYPKLEKKVSGGELHIMNGKYREDRFQSNYCIPSLCFNEFEKLISGIRKLDANILLSYSEDDESKDTRKRVISKTELFSILENHYSKIDVRNLEHRYRKLTAKNMNRKEMHNSELLIACRI